MTLSDKLFYSAVAAVTILFLSFTFAPKRTRRTVDYLLDTARAILNIRKGDTATPVEVRDFETKVLPKVPDPRTSGETKP